MLGRLRPEGITDIRRFMRKHIIGIALVLLAGSSALAQDSTDTKTRFGRLTVSEDQKLLFQGRPFEPPIEGNNGLAVAEPYQIGATDVVLVTDLGGTACPATYYFVTVSKSGAQASPSFGTCSDLTTVKRTGDSISVSMPGFAPPFDSKMEKRKAARERHVFIFSAGVLTD